MASGLPVLANLDHEAYTTVFRRYAFLNECPILSSSPETSLITCGYWLETHLYGLSWAMQVANM